MWNRVNYFHYFAKIFFITSIIFSSNVSLGDQLRFDMHIAFRGSAERELESWTKENSEILKAKNLFRPRFGVFAQSPHCAEQNESHESEIPTFTANFLANDAKASEGILSEVLGMILENVTLRRDFLRARVEAQWAAILYNPESQILESRTPAYAKAFPSMVKGEEYFDAHIHLEGIKDAATYKKAAELAGRLSMPIIANVLKDKPRPFITVRWYNSTREDAFKGLEEIYRTLYPAYQAMGIQMERTPEFEVTLSDPQCQITDRGWMPTPWSPFTLEERHFEPSPRVFDRMKILQ